MKNILISLLLLFIGFFINQIYSKIISSNTKKIILKEQKQIIKQLIQMNKNNILINNCEIVDSNNLKVLKTITVGDFLTNYIDVTLDSSIEKKIECSARKENMCSLSFGESGNKGWNRFLFFEYDFKNKIIVPNSLECLDVP